MGAALAAVLAVLSAGCQRDVPAPPAALPAGPSTSDTAATLPPDSILVGDWTATAEGQRDGDVLQVQRLLLRRAGQAEPAQVIDGLQTQTPWPAGQPGLEAVDMDFDGHPDLRLIEFRAAGPNTPWLHWLYRPGDDGASGRFEASPALDALSPTRFDAERRQVIVDWRDGAARSGSDAYEWRDGSLQRARSGP